MLEYLPQIIAWIIIGPIVAFVILKKDPLARKKGEINSLKDLKNITDIQWPTYLILVLIWCLLIDALISMLTKVIMFIIKHIF